MAYSLPPKDDRPSSYFSPNPSDRSYFTEHAIRAGYSAPIDSRESEFQRYPNDLRDPVDWEIERERIRSDLREREMARRRILEDEIRMELMLEREIELQRWEASRTRSDPPSVTPQFAHEPRISQPSGHFEERRLLSRPVNPPSGAPQYAHEPLRTPQPLHHFEGRMYPLIPMAPSRLVVGFGGSQSSPYQHHPMPVATSSLGLREIKPLKEPRRETTVWAKREADTSGLNRKRKASTHDAGRDLDKKPKRWICEMCNVHATCENNLKDHLKGKKHQLMLEGVPPQSIGTSSSSVIKEFTANTNKPTKTSGSPSDPNMKKAVNAHRKPSSNKPNMKKNTKPNGKSSENMRAEATDEDKKQKFRLNSLSKVQKPGPSTAPGKVSFNKKFRYWCKICQVGSNSEISLSAHEKGKRHLQSLEDLKAAPGSSSAIPPLSTARQ